MLTTDKRIQHHSVYVADTQQWFDRNYTADHICVISGGSI